MPPLVVSEVRRRTSLPRLLAVVGVLWMGGLHAQSPDQPAEPPRDALPHLRISAAGVTIPDEPKLDVTLAVELPGAGTGYVGPAGVELRGRSSLTFAKKSFGLELRDAAGEDFAYPLLGLPADDDWVLHGPYADRTLMRNALSYRIARATGRYAPRTRYCHLSVDGDYRGLYLLVEKVQPHPARVDIDPADAATPPAEGDYLLEINFERERAADGWQSRLSSTTEYDLRFEYQFVRPRPSEITAAQADYLEDWMHELEAALRADGTDFDPGEYVDLDAWVDYVLANELARDVDAYNGSTYLVKRGRGKLAPGPVWDHNFAYGNADYAWGSEDSCDTAVGFAIDSVGSCVDKPTPLIFGELWRRPTVRRRAAARWAELRQGAFGPTLHHVLDSLETVVASAQARNFARWPVHGRYLWPNEFVGDNWAEDVDYLRDWLHRRLAWLDQAFLTIADAAPGDELDFAVHPNPAPRGLGAVATMTTPVAGPVRVQLLDYAGTTLYEGAFANRYATQPLARNLEPGIYLVRMSNGTTSATRRLIVSD